MNGIKVLCWNMEWMNDLFDEAGNYHPDAHKPVHATDTTVLTRRKHLSGVINDIDADVIVIVEGPNKALELQRFFDTDVAGVWKTHIQTTAGSSQCIGCAVRVDTAKFDATNPMQVFDTQTIAAFKPFDLVNEEDGITERYKFERYPAYAEITLANQKKFRILGLHLKSKGIFSAYEWSKFWSVADGNRKKILAQCSQLRQQFTDKYLEDATTKDIPLIICGDINDGPGLDASEKRLFGSGIERLMGNVWKPQYCLGNALFDTLTQTDKDKLNFEKIHTTSFKDPIFNNVWHYEWIDHILYSHLHKNWVGSGKVHARLSDNEPIYKKFKFASDHLPISVIVNL
jgi:exonuclease III